MVIRTVQQVAVIGAGIAGAACARALTLTGHSVHVFDKSRGPGGRLATRRVEWIDRQGQACTTQLDHGAIGITARSEAFQTFVDQALHAGWLAEWAPMLAPGGLPFGEGNRLYVPAPDMPALCRRLLDGAAATWGFAVDSLHKDALGWQVQAGGNSHPLRFDAVLLALPPAQAAPLLSPHRGDWARHASVVPMQPCWTLMGIADASEPGLGWDLARLPTGPLAWVLRNDSRPGRARVPGQAHWVVHAQAGWSRRHLEQPAAWVQQQMQTALADYLGRHVDWHHCVVHRWRYALPQAQRVAPAESCWWDATQGLGVCGDFLGGSGVEGAWLSAQSLSATLLQRASDVADTPTQGVPNDLPSPVVIEPVNGPVKEALPLTVLYDGACPLCRREIGIYRGLRSSTPVCFADVSDAALPLPAGTTREQLLARFHVRSSDGRLLSGAQAFLALWAALPGWRWLARAGRLPGAAWVMERTYRLFLRGRPTLQRWASRLDPPGLGRPNAHDSAPR